MNKNIDLTVLLKDCPKGYPFYSPMLGKIEFEDFFRNSDGTISVLFRVAETTGTVYGFRTDAKFHANGDIMVFPAKDQMDWSKFQLNTQGIKSFADTPLQSLVRRIKEIEPPIVYWFKCKEGENERLMDELMERMPLSTFVYKPCQEIKDGQIAFNVDNRIVVMNDTGANLSAVVKLFGTELRLEKDL